MKKSEPLSIFQTSIHSSRFLFQWIVGGALLAGTCLFFLESALLQFALLCYLVGDGKRVLNLHVWRLSPQAVVYCQHLSSSLWRLKTRSGQVFFAKLTECFRSRWLIILNFKKIADKKSVVLLISYDALPKQNYTLLLSRLWDQ